MATKNTTLSQLNTSSTYLEIFNRELMGRVHKFQSLYPERKIHIMAWGDTSQPLPPIAVKALIDGANKLGNADTYTGYEAIAGNSELKKAICVYYQKLGIKFDSSEIFVNDGAQSSSVNLQELFAKNSVVALQHTTDPSFIEGNLLAGRNQFIYLNCNESKLPQDAYLVNVGRGRHLVEKDLLSALDSGKIAGAFLDVFRTEPLPKDNPFWSHPRIIVTPHIAAPGIPSDVANQIINTINNFQNDQPLENLVDLKQGY